MAIRGDSYGSLAEVAALTRHLLRGQSTFNSTTRPTATEVEKMIDRVSGTLNSAARVQGVTTPVTNTTAKLDCDNWVVGKTAQYVEMTIRGAGSRRGGEGAETVGGFIAGLMDDAKEFAATNRLGWIRLGQGVSHQVGEALSFTGETARADRADPDDSSLAQPAFKRGRFGHPGIDIDETGDEEES